MYDLPEFVTSIHRPDNTLVRIRHLLEKDLEQLPEGTELTAFVSDFRVEIGIMKVEHHMEINKIIKSYNQLHKYIIPCKAPIVPFNP